MAKKIILLVFASLFLFMSLPLAYAHCPLCTAAIGAAAVSAKYYGLDASIIGLLIGAFGVSTGLWFGLKIKKQYFEYQLSVIVLASFLLTVIPLLYVSSDSIYLPLLLFGKAGTLLNKVYWVNKILFGSIIGALVTLTAFLAHNYIKKINGRVLFPFQGIVITIAVLTVSGIGLYFILGV